MKTTRYSRTKKLSTYFLFTLSILTFISCNKNENQTEGKNLSEFHLKSQETASSLELLGIEHNKFLDYLVTSPSFLSNTAKEQFDFGSSYKASYLSLDISELDWQTFQSNYQHTLNLLDMTPEEAVNLLVEEKAFSKDFYYLALEICTILAEENNYEEFQTKISKLQDRINNKYKIIFDSSTRIGNEAALFYGACVIAKHSAEYWYNAENDTSNPWNTKLMSLNLDPNNNDPQINAIRLPRWIRAAGKDISTFFSSGNCTTLVYEQNDEEDLNSIGISYDIGCAWNNASNASSLVQ